MSYQSLHSSSKFRCFRSKFLGLWLISPKEKNFAPAPALLCLAGEITSVDPDSAPPCSLTPGSKFVFPFEGLELSRLKNIFLLYISLYLLWKPDSGISVHVLCFNVCVLCFNVNMKIKHLPCVPAPDVFCLFFFWLCWVLVAARGIFIAMHRLLSSCGVQASL